MQSRTFSAVSWGVDGRLVEVEAVCYNARPEIQITGLPGHIVRESKERIRACLSSLGHDVPSARVVVNLQPAGLPKEGSQLDFAIAAVILAVEGIISPQRLGRTAFLGELALDGRILPAPRAMGLLQCLAAEPAIERVLVSSGNALEAGLVDSPKVKIAASIAEGVAYLKELAELPSAEPIAFPTDPGRGDPECSLDDIAGQGLAKRVLEIALAGRHHVLFIGPPGVGKSMLARCAPRLMPPLSREEALDVLKIRSTGEAVGAPARPFRAPHHSVSAGGLLGGGTRGITPGEVTLAHRGLLFLDEFPEFRRDAVEALREPLENRTVSLQRVGYSIDLPADFVLIATMNPCPCGQSLSDSGRCRCGPERVASYRRKLSGPILDRIDLMVVVTEEDASTFRDHRNVQAAIASAWAKRKEREQLAGGASKEDVTDEDRDWLRRAGEKHGLSFRARSKVLRVARTIADLEGGKAVERKHLLEAWGLRCDFATRLSRW